MNIEDHHALPDYRKFRRSLSSYKLNLYFGIAKIPNSQTMKQICRMAVLFMRSSHLRTFGSGGHQIKFLTQRAKRNEDWREKCRRMYRRIPHIPAGEANTMEN